MCCLLDGSGRPLAASQPGGSSVPTVSLAEDLLLLCQDPWWFLCPCMTMRERGFREGVWLGGRGWGKSCWSQSFSPPPFQLARLPRVHLPGEWGGMGCKEYPCGVFGARSLLSMLPYPSA